MKLPKGLFRFEYGGPILRPPYHAPYRSIPLQTNGLRNIGMERPYQLD
jgi:hypothetical protein